MGEKYRFEFNALGVFAIDGYQNNSGKKISAYTTEPGFNVLFALIPFEEYPTHHVLVLQQCAYTNYIHTSRPTVTRAELSSSNSRIR